MVTLIEAATRVGLQTGATRSARVPGSGDPAIWLRIDEDSGVTAVAKARLGRHGADQSTCPLCPGGREAPDLPVYPFGFDNRWPALPTGPCMVIAYSADHDADLANAPR